MKPEGCLQGEPPVPMPEACQTADKNNAGEVLKSCAKSLESPTQEQCTTAITEMQACLDSRSAN